MYDSRVPTSSTSKISFNRQKQMSETHRCSVKICGINASDYTKEEVIESLCLHIDFRCIKGMLFDQICKRYVLFLRDIESTCRLIGKKIQIRSHEVTILPFLEVFEVNNVYPSVTKKDLCSLFGKFGKVFEINEKQLQPNMAKFSHIMSGEREISYILPGDTDQVNVPSEVHFPPYLLKVTRLCCACFTSGHSILMCPDREIDSPPLKPSFNQQVSDSLSMHSDVNSTGHLQPTLQISKDNGSDCDDDIDMIKAIQDKSFFLKASKDQKA